MSEGGEPKQNQLRLPMSEGGEPKQEGYLCQNQPQGYLCLREENLNRIAKIS